MPNPSLTLWVDSQSSRIVSGWQSLSSATTPVIKQGDKIGVEIHWVSSYSGGFMSEVVFPSSVNMTLAIGRIDAVPIGGSFKFLYASAATSELPYNATALQVQTALNALAGITADGGVSVTKITTSYRIIWNNSGVPSSTLTVASNDLYPSSTIGVNNIRTGTSEFKQIYQIHIKQAPVANITSFVTQSQATASYDTIHTQQFAGDTSVWRVYITPEPRDGSFIINFSRGALSYGTAPISIESSAEAVQSALNYAYNSPWTCIKTGKYTWDISTIDEQVYDFSVDSSGVISFNSKYGVLDMNTAEVEDLLAGTTSATAVLEVEVEADGTRQTILQTPCTILNDLIDSDTYTTVSWGDLMPVDSVVRFDTAQTLTVGEQQQARDNIGALDPSDISSLVGSDSWQQSRISVLEGIALTQNQFNAINEASTLSATDPLLAQSQIETLLDGKTDLVHTHIIDDVEGLSLTLSQKALTSHTHLVADITDINLNNLVTPQQLADGLATKAALTHTHTTLDTVYISDLTVPKIDFDDGTNMQTAGIPDVPAIPASKFYLRTNGGWQEQALIEQNIIDALTNSQTYTPDTLNPFATHQWYFGNPYALVLKTTSTPGFSGNYTTSTHPLTLRLFNNGQIYEVPMKWIGTDPNPPYA